MYRSEGHTTRQLPRPPYARPLHTPHARPARARLGGMMRLHPNTTKTRSHEPCGETLFARQSNSRRSAHPHTHTHTAHQSTPHTRHTRHTPHSTSQHSTSQHATLVHAARDAPCSRSLLAAATAIVSAALIPRAIAAALTIRGHDAPKWQLPTLAALLPHLPHSCRTLSCPQLPHPCPAHTPAHAGKDYYQIRKLISDLPWKTESHEPPLPQNHMSLHSHSLM